MSKCEHPGITLKSGHLVCAECGQHELFTEISSEGLVALLQWIEKVYDQLIEAGMEGAARTLEEKAGELVFNKRLVWKLGEK